MSRSGPIHRTYAKSAVGRSASASIVLRWIQRASVSVSATRYSASSAITPSLIHRRSRNSMANWMSRGSVGRYAASAGSSDGPKSGPSWMSTGPSFATELARAIEEERRRVLGRAQPLLVRDLLRELQRKEKIIRRAGGPSTHDLRRRNRIEGRVDLNGVEGARVQREIVRRASAVGIKRAHPGVVVPSLGTDPDRRHATNRGGSCPQSQWRESAPVRYLVLERQA